MGGFLDFFKFKQSKCNVVENKEAVEQVVHTPTPTENTLNQHFVLNGNVYRNADMSIPDAEQFLDLGLTLADYSLYAHGVTQSDMQNRLMSGFKENRNALIVPMNKRINGEISQKEQDYFRENALRRKENGSLLDDTPQAFLDMRDSNGGLMNYTNM